uniref:Translation initiation factor IF-2, chloroplastic n=1 Tax=Ptilothamnion sphaericum TaxID=1498216 RepID=A0A4D6WY87_9FLOR|nr:Translation initiation factor 2 [Ptilothamnion sphaericum]
MKISEKESLYYLKCPKIIVRSKIDLVISNKDLLQLNKSVVNLTTNISEVNTQSKFEKKYNNNDSRKPKHKSGKKNRKNLSIDKDDLYNIDLIKNHKFSKVKKKEKNQVDTDKYETKKRNQAVTINSPLTIENLSQILSIPEAEIITYLFLQGIAVTINQVIDVSIARDIALHYNFSLDNNQKFIESESLIVKSDIFKQNNLSVKRPPIITILGHVDHGKTTLLDSILKTNLIKQESGGITQAISGYEIDYCYESKALKLVFLDTPGHEAFASMRLRGAKVADIVLLVIAADDGLKPQTIESIKAILEMKLSYIIVINKIDKPNTNINFIKEELSKYGIFSKEWGGEALIIEVSALTGKNLDILLQNIYLLSEKQNLSANPSQLGQGTILEAYIDRQQGIVANILVQNGTLRVGDLIVAGNIYGKIKKIVNVHKVKVEKVSPSSIVQILGFSKLPEPGVVFYACKEDKEIKKYIDIYNQNFNSSFNSNILNSRIAINDLSTHIKLKQLNLIIKTDTRSSLEALMNSLSQISQSKVQLNLVAANAGNISRADLDLAITSQAIIVGFNIEIMSNVKALAKNKKIKIHIFNVIYELLDHITNSMLDLVEPEYEHITIGKAVVQTVFNINKGFVAGCFVNTGKLKKMCHINIYRDDNLIHTGLLNSLKRIKEDVDEVLAGNECGVLCDTYNLWNNNDVIEAYELKNKQKVL